ncbi:MAG TPA: hypothetical protein VJJ80_02675 [Patescibacteria group bacterium]|nr:hypothetical protein [Patescibacteria group bacterium]
MTSETEGYQPGEEEVQAAEEMMDDKQKRESMGRERDMLDEKRLEEGEKIGDPTEMLVDHFQTTADKMKVEGLDSDARSVEKLISIFQNFSNNAKKEYEKKKSLGLNPVWLREDKRLAIFYSGRGIELVNVHRGVDVYDELTTKRQSPEPKTTIAGPLGRLSEKGWKIFYESTGIDENLMEINKEAFDKNYKSAKDKHNFSVETEESTNIPGVRLRARSNGANFNTEYYISYSEDSVRILFDNTFMNRMRNRSEREK